MQYGSLCHCQIQAGHGGVEGAARKVRACDRVLVEYGKESQEEETPDGMPGCGEESERPELVEAQSGADTNLWHRQLTKKQIYKPDLTPRSFPRTTL